MTNPPEPPAREPESETAQLVRLRIGATEAYTLLYQVYAELRATGHAFAWSTAYEASGHAGELLVELGKLLNHPPTQEPTPSAAPCYTTQHCAALGWCHRCEPATREAVTHVVKAVAAMGFGPSRAGDAYDAVMEVLRGKPNTGRLPVLQIPAGPDPDQGEPCPAK